MNRMLIATRALIVGLLVAVVAMPSARAEDGVLVLGRVSDDPNSHYAGMKLLLDHVVERMHDVGIREGRVLMARDALQMASYLRRGRVDWVSKPGRERSCCRSGPRRKPWSCPSAMASGDTAPFTLRAGTARSSHSMTCVVAASPSRIARRPAPTTYQRWNCLRTTFPGSPRITWRPARSGYGRIPVCAHRTQHRDLGAQGLG